MKSSHALSQRVLRHLTHHPDLWLALALVILAALYLFVDARQQIWQQQAQTQAEMLFAGQRVREQLENAIDRLHNLALLFASEQSALLRQLQLQPNDPVAQSLLRNKVTAYFPQYLAFTLADRSGDLVMEDDSGLIGKGCRRDIRLFASRIQAGRREYVYSPHIHFNPSMGMYDRHFDVMVPTPDNQLIFFVSIRAVFLQQHMRRLESELYRFLLLDHEQPTTVELTSSSQPTPVKRFVRLNDTEQATLVHIGPISQTAWMIAVQPRLAVIARLIRKTQLRNFTLFILWLLAILAGLMLFRHEKNRRQRLHALNEQYLQEIEYRRNAEEHINKLTNFDPVTTLPNRKSAQKFLRQVVEDARNHQSRPAVLFIDIDHFAHFNDAHGHQAGDELLMLVARRLGSAVQPGDMLARWGGDDFVIILPHAPDRHQLGQFAEQLVTLMHQPFKVQGTLALAQISIGIANWPEAGEDAEALFKNADHALHAAKSHGRNCWRFFLKEMNEEAHRRIALKSDMRRAIQTSEFEPWFQPKMDLRSGRYCGAEMLARWRHPQKGVLPPSAFLPLAEETGMMRMIGEQLRNKVCTQMQAWQDSGLKSGQIAINLSGREFEQERLVEHMQTKIQECQLDPGLFQLEITESQIMADSSASLARLFALKEIGFSLAIDDFGSGYSSLAYLKRFPVDVLKIDRSFITDCTNRAEDRDILRMIIQLAHGLSLTVVAEGVEHEEQLQVLRGLGCDQIQGYFYAQPMPAEAFGRFLRRINNT